MVWNWSCDSEITGPPAQRPSEDDPEIISEVLWHRGSVTCHVRAGVWNFYCPFSITISRTHCSVIVRDCFCFSSSIHSLGLQLLEDPVRELHCDSMVCNGLYIMNTCRCRTMEVVPNPDLPLGCESNNIWWMFIWFGHFFLSCFLMYVFKYTFWFYVSVFNVDFQFYGYSVLCKAYLSTFKSAL